MFDLILIAMIAIIPFLIGYGICALIYHTIANGHQKLSLKEYFRISACCPEKWMIFDGIYHYLHYYPDGKTGDPTEIWMKTYFDELKLSLLYRSKNKRRLENMYARERAELLKQWQRDINDYQDKYMEQVKVYYKKGKVL